MCRVPTSVGFNKAQQALGPGFRSTPYPIPKKRREGRSILRSQACLPFQFLLVPSADRSTGSKPSFGPRGRPRAGRRPRLRSRWRPRAARPSAGVSCGPLHWTTRRPRRAGPHLRRAAVAILVSDRLDAAGAGHSDIAALKAQVYAHHRHGAGYCSGSGPGPAADTAHGPRRGWRVEKGEPRGLTGRRGQAGEAGRPSTRVLGSLETTSLRRSGRLRLRGSRGGAGSGGGEALEGSRCDRSRAAARELRRNGMFSRDTPRSDDFPPEAPPRPGDVGIASRPGTGHWGGSERTKAVGREVVG